MAQYFFKVPVIVKCYDENDEFQLLPTHEEVSSFVANNMMQDDLTKYFWRVKKAKSLTAAADGDSVRVMITAAGKYSDKTAKLLLEDLEGQCSDGWGENGWELYGFNYGYYGYEHHKIYVSPWEPGKSPTIMTPEGAKIRISDKKLSGSKVAAQRIVEFLESAQDMYRSSLKPTGHDDREALGVTLDKALSTARNVLKSEK